MRAFYFPATSGKFSCRKWRKKSGYCVGKTNYQHWSLRPTFVGLKKIYENACLDLWKTGLDNFLKMCDFHKAFLKIAPRFPPVVSGYPVRQDLQTCRAGGKTTHASNPENRFTLFGIGFWVPTHLVRKPFHTFRDKFLNAHASCPKTASHFSG